MRFAAIAPLLFTIAAFVLAMLCLFAGSKKGFMEDYDIITVRSPPLISPFPYQPTNTPPSSTSQP